MFEEHEFQRLVLEKLDLILANQATISQEVTTMSDTLVNELNSLQTAVTNETSVDQSAVTLINGIPALIQNAINTALQNGATQAQLQSFATLNSQLMTNAAALAAAVTANTQAQAQSSVGGAASSVAGAAQTAAVKPTA
jgi:hypothetical protein